MATKKELTYEQAISRLEEIVGILEKTKFLLMKRWHFLKRAQSLLHFVQISLKMQKQRLQRLIRSKNVYC